MRIDVQKLDERIKKLQEIRRIAVDPESAMILREFVSVEDAVPEPVMTIKSSEPRTLPVNISDVVNDVVNGTSSDMREGFLSRRR